MAWMDNLAIIIAIIELFITLCFYRGFKLSRDEVAYLEQEIADRDEIMNSDDDAERVGRIETLLGTILENQETLMSTFEESVADIKAKQDVTDTKVATVKADVEKLLGLLAAVPPAGLTPEQQAALDAVAAHAGAINDSLAAVDAEVNPPVVEPAPEAPAA